MNTMRVSQCSIITLSLALLAFHVTPAARAVEVSASTNTTAGLTNHMGLPAVGPIFDPGLADFGTPGLAAPAVGTSSVTVPFAYPANAPNAGNPVQMYGDAVSSVTNLGAGSFQLEVILTNFWIDQGTALPTTEYVYLNVWETFTNLGLPANLSWSTSGSISVNGTWAAPGPNQFVAIEPIAIVFDPGSSSWTNASFFFGDTGTGPGSGLLSDSEGVTLPPTFVSGGQLMLGMQTILQLQDIVGFGGAQMHLPTSLHLSVTLTPVPEPSTSALAAAAFATLAIAVARRRQR